MKKYLQARDCFAFIFLALLLAPSPLRAANIIEEQLEEIGKIPDDEVVVVQRKYTRKNGRFELMPVAFGGVPFGTVRRTLFGGASLNYHMNDWFAFEVPSFIYTKTFFSSFTSDINAAQNTAGKANINVDDQKLLFFLTGGIQITPFYGKLSTFSHYIAYLEPYFTIGGGMAKTETSSYFTFYPGIGFRLFFKEWFSMRFDLRDYIYTEVSATQGNRLRNNYAFTVSLSFWLPKMPSY